MFNFGKHSFSYFLFDLNGTMIDDMEYHVRGWHTMFQQLGVDISYEATKLQCYGKNDEVMERVCPGRFTPEEKAKISWQKEEIYQAAYKPHLKLIEGLPEFLEKAHDNGIKMAIGSAAIMFNIDFVLDNLHIRHYFDAIVSADDVQYSKPHPETYLSCAARLGAEPAACLVFEDVVKGVESADRAGMKALVIEGFHHPGEFDGWDNIITSVTDYRGLAEFLK